MSVARDFDTIDDLDLDPAVRPQDDLFGHVNGRWVERTEIPDDRATHGSFAILNDMSEEQVRTIITDAAEGRITGEEATKIGDLYASFVDEETVEALGAAPLESTWGAIAGLGDTDELVALMGRLAREGVGGVVSLSPWVDRGNPERYLLHFAQSGLGLPDESYYRLDEHAEIRSAYVGHVERMMALAAEHGLDPIGGRDAAGAAEDVMALETRLAAAHWDRTATRDAVRTYNLVDADGLTSLLPTAPTWLTAMGLAESQWTEVVVGQPDVLEAVSVALEEVDLGVWQRWLAWRVLRGTASYLSSPFVDERFDFTGRILTGAKELKERWKRGVATVQGVMGEAVGKLYVERHYPPEAEAQMAELVDNLLKAYEARISTLEWMAEETRKEALAKLATFRPKIGRPVKWRDYGDLVIDPADLVGNLRRAAAFTFDWEVGKVDRPVDRDEWFMTPQTVNAYYNPAMNEIVFPAAILQPPFFDPTTDPAYNYGAIGAVIGHEIGHGFDDQGSRYDGSGTLRDWWTEGDRERFDERAQALKDQYSAFSPRDLGEEHTVNGELTVGENIGDLGGVAVAHHAYRLSLGGQEAPVVDGLTGDQRFFVGWARVWRVASRKEEAIRRLTVDPHSPPEFRVNVVRNIDAFHEAFATSPEDGLWLEEDQRVAIW
ncbi:M13 family metallopeptidase [Euzebya rosea]|uniref:M13 family metallopeptidase n=1 Tax=Euzebya rosea TaxID=2052804 RepID=UPI000D3ED346|nr:M13-type metalloendopeptidase [Euzebya rosea]